jgi:synaptobrevin family protein YKT6
VEASTTAQADLSTGWHLHTFSRSEGVGAVIVADQEYPGMVAQSILSRLLDEFITKNPKSSWPLQPPDYSMRFPELPGYLAQYQNPENADSLMKIQKELDETKVVLHNTINAVLDRGEKLEDLEAKSKDLQGKSYFQYQQAKKMNSCWYGFVLHKLGRGSFLANSTLM